MNERNKAQLTSGTSPQAPAVAEPQGKAAQGKAADHRVVGADAILTGETCPVRACSSCGVPLAAENPVASTLCRRCQFPATQTVNSYSQDESTGGGEHAGLGEAAAFEEPSTAPTAPDKFAPDRILATESRSKAVTGTERRRIDRFEILGELGKGGFGRVYRAIDPKTGTIVALKMPRLEKFDSNDELQKFLISFRQEGRNAQALKHPHIVQVYECGPIDDGNNAYIAMECVDGESLAERLARNPSLSFSETASMIRKVADALHHATNHGFLHRDIKPANILLTKNGEPKVVDFGLAVHEDDQRFLDGEYAGTLSYMPPEQLDRRVSHMDGRADIWSLGVVLYLMLSGRHPFEGTDNAQLEEAIRNKPFRPVTQRNPSIPAAFDEILARCLAKRVEDRFLTAGELSAALKRYERRGHIRRAIKWSAAVAVTGSAGALAGLFGQSLGQPQGPIEVTHGTDKWINLPADPPKQVQPGGGGPVFDVANKGRVTIDHSDLVLIQLGTTLAPAWFFETDIEVSPSTHAEVGLFWGLQAFPNKAGSLIYHRLVLACHWTGSKYQWSWKRDLRALTPIPKTQQWVSEPVDDSFNNQDRHVATHELNAPRPHSFRLKLTVDGGAMTKIAHQNLSSRTKEQICDASWTAVAVPTSASGAFGVTSLFANDKVCFDRLRFLVRSTI